MGPTRLSPATRNALRIAGPAFMVVGLTLMVSGVMRTAGSFGTGDFDAARQGGMVGFAIGAGGMLLMFVGTVLAKFGYLGPLSEVVATETGTATEYTAQRVGRGLGAGLQGQIRIRCKGCGSLDSEDARFCSGCGQPM